MKWFKHFSDAHRSLKLKALLKSHGLKGYGVWWVVCELCAKEGKSESNWSLEASKEWKSEVRRVFDLDHKWLYRFLRRLAKLHLIDGNELKKGNLCIPQMVEYCDDYSDRVRRESKHSSDKVPLEEKRVDKIRREEKKPSSFNKLKPYYRGEPMRLKGKEWWVIPKEGGQWKKFAGDTKDIKYL